MVSASQYDSTTSLQGHQTKMSIAKQNVSDYRVVSVCVHVLYVCEERGKIPKNKISETVGRKRRLLLFPETWRADVLIHQTVSFQ